MSNRTFKGFARPDGSVGVRNHVLILPCSVCANKVASDVARQVEGAVWLNNTFGCCQLGGDARLTEKTLVNAAGNPNVGAIVVIGLGCEGAEPARVTASIKAFGKPVACVTIQAENGTLPCQAKATELAQGFAQDLSLQVAVDTSIRKLVLAIECGGSDATSGLASNPACGIASDTLIGQGGTAMLSETTELIGAEQILADRAVTKEVGDQLLALVHGCEERAKALGEDIRGGQPTPGNIEGGLTTIEEKSLGCTHKSGTSPLQGVLTYAERVARPGLWVMDTPGQDIESVSGMVAGGAQIVIFTTGRGTPTGNPISPVIKITANARTAQTMRDHIDIDVSPIMDGERTIAECGADIFEEIIRVANGKRSKAEALGHDEFSIYKSSPTF